jgi:hypothetical protein
MPESSSNNQDTFFTQLDSFKNSEKTKLVIKSLDDLSLHDWKLQEVMHELLKFTPQERKEEANSTRE